MGKDLTKVSHTFFICNGGSCQKKGAELLTREVRCALKMQGLHDQVHTVKTLCQGQCLSGPLMFTAPDNVWYKEMELIHIPDLIDQHIKKDQLLETQLLYQQGQNEMYATPSGRRRERHVWMNLSDPYLGAIKGFTIYPWELNIYPLLKELFEVYFNVLDIAIDGQLLASGTYKVSGMANKAAIQDSSGQTIREVVMKASEADKNRKIDTIMLYKEESAGLKGVYMANAAEGMILNASWNGAGNFWNHLLTHYAGGLSD